jgi:hypothetical protein
LAAKVTPALARVPTWSREAWLRFSEVGGAAPAGGGGGGGGLAGVQPDSVTVREVDPSPTVALQLADRKLEALNLNLPSELALPDAADSDETTVIVAFG